jgi:16S rRNA (guanine527-N7)-methyltransferase
MEEILRYFPGLSEKQKSEFGKLDELYRYWNERINLISRKDIDNLYPHHILHSLALAKVMPLQAGAKILDVGTGGGFPGIPLAIYFPEVSFHLVDSIGKKIKVVDAVVKDLGLTNVTYEQIRAEQLKNKYDFVVSRAVTLLPEFVTWINGKINTAQKHKVKNGVFYLKGGDLKEELASFKNIVTVFDISDFFKEEYFETKKIIYLPVK